MEANADSMTIYEVGYHIGTHLPEEKIPGEVSFIKEILSKVNAEVISEEYPKLTPLAYTLVKKTQSGSRKCNDAYFGWIKFSTGSEDIASVKAELEKNDNIIRCIVIKTVRENTMPVKVFATKKTDEDGEGKEEITEEDEKQIDEKIDDLVIEEA